MEPAMTGHEAIGHADLLVHKWRVSQLARLGIPQPLAEVYADRLDWHEIAPGPARLSRPAGHPHRLLTSYSRGPAAAEMRDAARCGCWWRESRIPGGR